MQYPGRRRGGASACRSPVNASSIPEWFMSNDRAVQETFCATHWHRLFVVGRRYGYNVDESQDLTQEFFTNLIRRELLGGLIDAGAKCRAYLLRAFHYSLVNHWHRQRCLKRGRGKIMLPLESNTSACEQAGFMHTHSPDRLLDRQWALRLLDDVRDRLGQEYTATGRKKVFDQLRICLPGGEDQPNYAALGAELKMSPPALRMAVHRLRRRYRELLRNEVARRVSRDQVDEEIRDLIAAVGQAEGLGAPTDNPHALPRRLDGRNAKRSM